MDARSHLVAAWLGGALVGSAVGLLLVSWLPLWLKGGGMVVVALALNLPATITSRSTQAGFLVAAGGVACLILMVNALLGGPVAVLLLLALAFGFVRTLQLAGSAGSA